MNRKSKGKKANVATSSETAPRMAEGACQENTSKAEGALLSNLDIQQMCRSVLEQQKQQELMYQDLKLIFQELIQQKLERQEFLQRQEAAISEMYRNLEVLLESAVLHIKDEMMEMQCGIIEKIESSRSYIRDAKDLKEAMLNKIDEEKSYLKGKIRDVQKELMSKIIDMAPGSDDGGRKSLGKQKAHKSRLSWFSKRGDYRRGAEYEQSEEPPLGQQIPDSRNDLAGDVGQNGLTKLDETCQESYHKNAELSQNSSTDYELNTNDHTADTELKDEPNEKNACQSVSSKDIDDNSDVQSVNDLNDEGTPQEQISQFDSRQHSSRSTESLSLVETLRGMLKDSGQQMQQEIVDSLDDKLEKVVKSLDASLTAVKHELFEVVEKEAQLVRDKMAHKSAPRSFYVCDFYVKYVRDMVKNGDSQIGPPWHIDQLGSCVKGYVETVGNGDMYVTLMYGRNPIGVGMLPRSGVKLKVKATIKDVMGDLPEVLVGEVVWNCDENGIKDNRIWGKKIGVVSGRNLLYKGYGDKEGYGHCAMLIRYEIIVC
ncbi:DNA double-strand break repair Rad50 ATPase [Biomphalaria glabrata]